MLVRFDASGERPLSRPLCNKVTRPMTTLPPPPSSDPSSEFLPLPIGHLFPNLPGDFAVYLRHGDHHTLFSQDGELVTPRHRAMVA